MAFPAGPSQGASGSSSSNGVRKRPQNPPRHSQAPPRSNSPGMGGSNSGSPSSGIDTVVTRLLVSTKTLLEGLTQWSLGNCTDDKISDMYVKLGNDLNAACAAFAREKISMNELLSVPDDLRTCLESCLSEDEASPATLERHLPAIKSIIVRLLQGLKSKQALYKSTVAEQRASSVPPVPPVTSPTSSTSAERVASPPPTSNLPAQPQHKKLPSGTNSMSSANSDVSSDDRMGDRSSSSSAAVRQRTSRSVTSQATMSDATSGHRAPSPTNTPIPRSQSAGSVPTSTGPAASTSSSSNNRAHASVPSFNFQPAPLPKPSTSADSTGDQPRPRLPSTLGSGQRQQQHPTDKSFETLKNQDHLVRRASKRFSRYTLDKMTGSPGRDELAAGGGSSPTPAHRRSFKPPPMPHSSSSQSLHPGSLSPSQHASGSDSWDTLSHEQQIEAARRPSDTWSQHMAAIDSQERTRASLSPLPETREAGSPTPPQEGPEQEGKDSAAPQETTPSAPVATQIYLQLGRETKKATLDPDQMPPTLASLQVLFMDRFSYNAGQEDFPLIYIRDPRLGVEYELEDMSEVREGCLLSLNIERKCPGQFQFFFLVSQLTHLLLALDQVKQHIDAALSGITLELKDLKATMTASRRSMPAPAMGWSPSTAGVASPTLGQAPFAQRRQSTVMSESSSKPPVSVSIPEHVSGTLRKYQDEVQSVRRDLAGLRQIYAEYSTDYKNVLTTMRAQLDRVKTIATNKVSGSRAFIDAGKAKLDGRSQDLLTRIEGLMDAVEIMREDVTVRRMRPAPTKMEDLRKQIEASRAELDEVLAYMGTVKPAWKKTWSEELQNVVEEQRFLKHQEELLEEMSEDHREMAAMFENIDELMKKMAPSPGASGQAKNGPRIGLREYIPPEVDRDHQGLSTVMTEVRSLAVDPDRRLKAIQEAEKAREASRDEKKQNEFAKELGGFVDSKQLRKTGQSPFRVVAKGDAVRLIPMDYRRR